MYYFVSNCDSCDGKVEDISADESESDAYVLEADITGSDSDLSVDVQTATEHKKSKINPR
jgi:hypothetical protein